MELIARIEKLIEPTIADMGYELVRVRLSGANPPVLQIMAEPTDERPMVVDDCAAISRNVSAVLDVDNPISGQYTLEVSSPGLDRPLVRPRDYDRFAGHVAKVETARPIDGRKRFRGRVVGTEDDLVRIALDDGEVRIPLTDIRQAKLVLTDELLAAGARSATED